MPVSGNEETVVKPIAQQSSDYSAGVPIKKRRFPLYRPPSPPPEEPSSLLEKNDSLPKDQPSPSQGSTLSNGVTTSSAGSSDTDRNAVIEEKKGSTVSMYGNVVQNADKSRIKFEELNLTMNAGSFGIMDNREQHVVDEKPTCQITKKMELQLASTGALALSVGTERCSKQNVEGKCKSEASVSGNAELSLGPKKTIVSSLASQNSQGSYRPQEGLETLSLNLSLTKGKSSTRPENSDVELKIDGSYLHSNRSNWDLNTTMDAWGGSTSDATIDQVHVGRLSATGGALDIKPSISSTRMAAPSIALGRQILDGNQCKSNYANQPLPCGRPSDGSLCLGLNPSSLQPNLSLLPASSCFKSDSDRAIPNLRLPSMSASTGNVDVVNCRTVKSEPLDESVKQDTRAVTANFMALLDIRAVKRELIDRSAGALRLSNSIPIPVDPRSIKSEPVNGGNRETLKTIEGTSEQLDKQVLQSSDNRSCATAMPVTEMSLCPTIDSICSKEETINGNTTIHQERSIYVKAAHITGENRQEACDTAGRIASEITLSVGLDGRESEVPGGSDTEISGNRTVDNPEQSKLKSLGERVSQGIVDGSASDEEKINLSGDMLEEDSYGSDYDSDGNHALDVAMDHGRDGGEDDYEDGEVREPLVQIAIGEPICEDRELEHANYGDFDNKEASSATVPVGNHAASSNVEEKDTKIEDHAEKNNNGSGSNGCLDKVLDEKSDEVAKRDACLQELLAVDTLTSGADIERNVKATQREIDQPGVVDAPIQETVISSHQSISKREDTVFPASNSADENVSEPKLVENNNSTLPKGETSSSGNVAAKDAEIGGSRSRIINLSRASNVSPPGKTTSVSGRSLPSRAGRERLPDVALEADKLYHRGRDDLIDGSHKFSRVRHQDQSPRNSRFNSMRGRGRGGMDTVGDNWDSERNFAPELYNGGREFRAYRHNKYASAVPDTDLEYNSYNVAPDGGFVGSGRGGRKPFNDDALIFRQQPSRRRSPGGRSGPAAHGFQMVHRDARNISPNRCIGEDGASLVGLRQSDKFMRGFNDDTIDTMFTRPQGPYEGGDGHFVRGNRNFPVQRRGLPLIRSKSPIRSRTRSPGPWASPRRRSPDGFGGHPELPHRRSPAIYRMERVRSPDPDHSCFLEMVRRHGSPSYMSRPSNDLRDMDSGRDHGHPRSVILNRSPPGRVLLRNRRFDGEEYFGPPMRAGRFPEIGADGNDNERRRLGERRGPVRSFRPYKGVDGENFHMNREDGVRPYRFGPEDGSEFHERGNLRGREFDRRIKNRPGDAPRRTRSIDEQEGNYRRGGQVWHDDGFDDVSRLKRKRL